MGRSALDHPRRAALRRAAPLAIAVVLAGATNASGDRHEPHRAASVASAPDGAGGHRAGHQGPDGQGPDGHAQAAGHHGADGHGPNGRGPDGHGPGGHGPNGRGPDGHGPPGHADQGDPTGAATRGNGHDGNGDGPHGHGGHGDTPNPAPATSPSPPVVGAKTPQPAPQPTAVTNPTPPPTPTTHPPAPTTATVVNGRRVRGAHPHAGASTASGTGTPAQAATPSQRRSQTSRRGGGVLRALQRDAAAGGRATGGPRRPARARRTQAGGEPPVLQTIERIVHVVPTAVKAIIAVLAFLALVAAAAYYLVARTARYLKRQRETLLGEIGVLQAALLPDVPDTIGGLRPSVAYRPAEGLGAGGDFYDAFALDGGRAGLIIGDISGHGRNALMRTSLLRHTLRAYLDAGLEPRAALQVGGKVLDRGFDDLATVILATYDPASRTLRYASAGHPSPILVGEADHDPVTVASSPPLGAGVPTGLRQTTIGLGSGVTVCLFTDGLIEARRNGKMVGRLGLAKMLAGLGDAPSAERLIDHVASQVDLVFDDMAACIFQVAGDVSAPAYRIEELEAQPADLVNGTAERFMRACGLDSDATSAALATAADLLSRYDAALVRVAVEGDEPDVAVVPANVQSLAVASLREAAG